MNRNSTLDFLGVARAIGLAAAAVGLVTAGVLLGFSLAGLNRGWAGTALVAWFGVFVIAPGLLVACIAGLSRVFVKRMHFHSETNIR